MRIISLVPGASEIVAALGAEPWLVGVSHECDYPPSVQLLPRVTWCAVDSAVSSAEIDAQVRAAQATSAPVIAIDESLLADLEPDLIITQTLCDVCAIADGRVHALRDTLPSARVLAMTGRTLSGVSADVQSIGDALGKPDAAGQLVAGMEARWADLASRCARAERPAVLCIEWLDPPYLAGHWVPELVRIAGGTDAAARPGIHSTRMDWERIDRTKADVMLVMLCGFNLARSRAELERSPHLAERLLRRGNPVWLIDGNAYTSRAGPRLVEAAECIAAALANGEHDGLERFG